MIIFIALISITYIALYVSSGVEYMKKTKHIEEQSEDFMKTWGTILLKFIFLLISFFYIFISVEQDINLSLSYLLFTFPLLINYIEKMHQLQSFSSFFKWSYGFGMLMNGIGISVCFVTFYNAELLKMNLIVGLFMITMFINLVFILAELIFAYKKEVISQD